MSWEGFYQSICENGHRFDHYDEESKCYICESPHIWINVVDDTNCSSVGMIRDFSPVMILPEIMEVCNLGHKHIKQHATYRVPQKNELERWWKNWECDYAWEKLPPKA